jgi:Na+-translocating ferredoxin:NAD+ oxidoreductase RnfD subunit
VRDFTDFLLSAHISGLAVAMLLYANERLWPVVFATAAAIGSKWVFRAPVGTGQRHFFNPSNFGITLTLLFFPWVGIAPPYHFTENLAGIGDWVIPAFIVVSGSFLNARFTHRLPLIAAWLGAFAGQALIRSWAQGTPAEAALLPMTGVAFILYTFYMVTDPATTPDRPAAQVVFGVLVAVLYGLLMTLHIVFTLFFALTIACAARGIGLWARAWVGSREQAPLQQPSVAGRV